MSTVGIDEVGRGCWAGPLVAGAVILKEPIPGLRDSKKLSAKRRGQLAKLIYEQSQDYGLGWVTPAEVDAIGLTAAVKLAMERALAQIKSNFTEIIIDGNYNYLPHEPLAVTLIKADDLIPSVSAASILAKVARDTYMANEAHRLFPQYQFDKHVGYGTKLHVEALRQYGPSSMHRMSYKPVAMARATMQL